MSVTLVQDIGYEYTGGVEGGGGWKGDVAKMRLGIETLRKLGWEPERSSDEAVERTAEWMVDEVV
jgi:UDP-glucose 4-epimerase